MPTTCSNGSSHIYLTGELRVSLNQISSRKILPRQGIPQGGVLSPTLFLVFINMRLPNCTNYRAETEAAILVKDSLVSKQTTQMQELCNTCKVVLQWIPAHCRIPGNEQADQLAKCGAQEEQPSTSIHYQEKTTIIKTALKHRQA